MILITGGAGYIGSHTVVELCDLGYEPIIFDNFCNSNPTVLGQINKITGQEVPFVCGDIRVKEQLEFVFTKFKIDAVIDFAGLKSVVESNAKPLDYYDNNVSGTLTLLEVMKRHNCYNFIFSSSATVYGEPDEVPIKETAVIKKAICPYGQTKIDVEFMCEEFQKAEPAFSIVLLRYFNPVGAHSSGLIGESPLGVPNNLMPYITLVSVGKLPYLNIFGNDYDTPDGTCIRDFIHVVDLAKGHASALNRCMNKPGLYTYNLGTGNGFSILQLVNEFQKTNDVRIPYKFAPRRDGDIVACYADVSKAKTELGWSARLSLSDMVRDSYNWGKQILVNCWK